ncbi:VOC family protein [Brevibacterium sp. UBA7493]|uniref:VOC family protein n=1 Tax=Brevibacterium sp. UBA7493 TaxID=1946121 RepID=UPI0032E3CDFE
MTADFRSGAPCWLDLGSPDPDRSQDFYHRLFGWEFAPPAGPDEFSIITSAGHTVGGFVDTRGMTDPDGQPWPSSFGGYVRSDDLGRTAERAQSSGAQPHEAPSLGEAGALISVDDPGGATVNVWQPGTITGFDLPHTPGTPAWFECRSTAFDAAAEFYRNVFDWALVDRTGAVHGGARYVTNGSPTGTLDDGTPCPVVCGLADAAAMPDPEQSSRWLTYFHTPKSRPPVRRPSASAPRPGRPGAHRSGRSPMSPTRVVRSSCSTASDRPLGFDFVPRPWSPPGSAQLRGGESRSSCRASARSSDSGGRQMASRQTVAPDSGTDPPGPSAAISTTATSG